MAESTDEFNALAEKEIVREIGRFRDRLSGAEAKLETLRESRDALIVYLRGVGVPVATLARDAGLSRVSIYNVLRRRQEQ